MRSARRGEKSVFELLQEMRDTEQVAFARMNAIANNINPDLDRLPDPRYFAEKDQPGFDRSPLSVLAQIRRLRQSTCALLRSLPDNAWQRVGTSRLEHDWQIRTIAEFLAENDTRLLHLIDVQLHTHRRAPEHQRSLRRASDRADDPLSRAAATALIGMYA